MSEKKSLTGEELYIVAYSVESGDSEDLKRFYGERKNIRRKCFAKNSDNTGNITFVDWTEVNATDTEEGKFCDDWINNRNIYATEHGVTPDYNIYVFNTGDIEKGTKIVFTLIMFDSRDDDSILCKDIVVKQYKESYKRNIENWKEDGVIVYDIAKGESVYPTYEGSHIFDPTLLAETDVDEVFICGYNIDKTLLNRFALNKEKLFIFESNPYKINEIRSTLRNQFSGRLCMSKTTSKALQAFTLFKDPIGNIKPEDNDALKVLKDYSDALCNNFTAFENWSYLAKVKMAFETKVQSNRDKFFGDLVDCLFNVSSKTINFDSNIEIADNNIFDNVVKNYPLKWTGDILALNTEEIPTPNQVYKLVSGDFYEDTSGPLIDAEGNYLLTDPNGDKLFNDGSEDIKVIKGGRNYSKIVTFYKKENKFWTVNVYSAPRLLANGISIHDAQEYDSNNSPKRWYTPTGVPVMKVTTNDPKFAKRVIDVRWFNISGKRNVQVNAFEENEYGQYVFNCENEWYELYSKEKHEKGGYGEDYDFGKKYYLKNASSINPRRFNKVSGSQNIQFDIVYEDSEDVDFNALSLISYMSNKYLCNGNKYVVEASMTDKQLYECLRTKSLV